MKQGPITLRQFGLRPHLGAIACLMVLAGCQTGRLDHDPLVGGAPLPPGPLPPRSTGNAVAAGQVPPPPAPSNTGSLASLTAGPTQTLDSTHDMRVPVTPVPGSTAGGPAGALLHGPEPVNDGSSRLTPIAAPGSTSGLTLVGGPPRDSHAQILEELRARGASRFNLVAVGDTGEWKFSCSVADKPNADMLQRYESRAFGEDGLAAMRAVLEQIDRERR